MKPMVVLAIIAFCFIFFQTVMNLFQYKGIKKQYSIIRSRCHYVSVGQIRRFGRVRMSLLGFNEDGLLEECWLLSGISFFARFRRIAKYEGIVCEDLPEMFNEKNKDQACILQAVQYMQTRLDNKASDEEYFADEYDDEDDDYDEEDYSQAEATTQTEVGALADGGDNT